MRELEPHQRVAGLQQRVVDGGVRLRARVRLDVGVLGAEQRLGPVDRELLGDVDVLAAAVVALARDSPRRTCWSAPSPGTRAPRPARSSPRRSSRASAAGARAPARGPRRSRDRPRRAARLKKSGGSSTSLTRDDTSGAGGSSGQASATITARSLGAPDDVDGARSPAAREPPELIASGLGLVVARASARCRARRGSPDRPRRRARSGRPGPATARTRREQVGLLRPRRDDGSQSALDDQIERARRQRSWSRADAAARRARGRAAARAAASIARALVDADQRRVLDGRRAGAGRLPRAGTELEDPARRRRRCGARQAAPGTRRTPGSRRGSSPRRSRDRSGTARRAPPPSCSPLDGALRARSTTRPLPPPRSGAGRRPSTACPAARRRRSRGRRPPGSARARRSAAARPARRRGSRSTAAPATARPASSGTDRHPQPERRRDRRRTRAEAAAPGSAAAPSRRRAAAARAPRASARPSSGSAASASVEVEEHHRRGLVGGRPLSR